jgi:flagellar hook-associated protein 3 FlgL
MRVTFNQIFRNGVADILRAAEELARRQREVSSLKRIQVPSDDPSASAAVVGERAEVRLADQYVRATDSVDSRLRVVDSVLTDIIKNIETTQVRAAVGRNSFINQTQRDALALEIEGLRDAILSDVNQQYRGTFLFSGTLATTQPFVKDAAGAVQPYAGNADTMEVDIDDNRAIEISLDGGAVVGSLFDDMVALANAVRTGDTAAVEAGMQAMEAAFDRVTNAQSRVGNGLSTLEDHKGRLSDIRRASEARRASLEEANLAESITRMQQADTAHRAALGAVSSAARLSLLDYLR